MAVASPALADSTARPTYAEDFGIDPTADDNTAALQSAINHARANSGWLQIPAGEFRTDTLYPSGVTMVGRGGGQVPTVPRDGATASVLVLRRSGIDLLSYDGAGGQVRGGYENLHLYTDVGVKARRMISLRGNATEQPDHLRFVAGRISGYKGTLGCETNVWGFACDRDKGPIGNRGIYFEDLDLFNAHDKSVVLMGFFDSVIISMHIYTGFGALPASGIWIGGDGKINSKGIQITASKTEGPLNISNCTDSYFQGQFGPTQQDAATTRNIQVIDF